MFRGKLIYFDIALTLPDLETLHGERLHVWPTHFAQGTYRAFFSVRHLYKLSPKGTLLSL